MSTKGFSDPLLPPPQPSQTHDSTYWDSVITASTNYTPSTACFVAAGFDMWVVWSQIISHLRRRVNTFNALFADIYLPDYDRDGIPSFRDTEPTYGKKLLLSLCQS